MKTIEDAVIELGGKWPVDHNYLFYRNNSYFCAPYNESPTYQDKAICSKSEFESCAKRLGYINGYRWGVEYPTNGKRPDLPKDARVSCKISGEWERDDDYSDEVDYWNWPKLQAFKVIGQRYKPADTSYLDAAIEISESKHEEATVSEKPESKQNEPDVSDLIIALSDASSLAVDLGMLDRAREIMSVCNSVKDKDAREKVIEAAENGMLTSRVSNAQRKTIKRLYDLGMLVLPPKKSDTND